MGSIAFAVATTFMGTIKSSEAHALHRQEVVSLKTAQAAASVCYHLRLANLLCFTADAIAVIGLRPNQFEQDEEEEVLPRQG